MKIEFVSPVYPVDARSQRAFIEILNLILLSDHAAELKRRLRLREFDEQYRSLSGYYKWSFEDHCFTLWQRMSFGSGRCFKQEILSIHEVTLLTQDRKRACVIKS